MTEQYVHVEISQNHRMSELEAAWLRLQLPDLAARQRGGAAIARRYRAAAPDCGWHADHPDHVVHQCVLRVHDRDGTPLGARRARRRDRRPLPARPDPAAGVPAVRRSTAARRRGVGRRVRVAAVLPRADRRRGRPVVDALGDLGVTLGQPRGRRVSAFFPCYNDELAIPRWSATSRRPGASRRRLRDHRRRRRLDGRLRRRAAPCSCEIPELRIVEHETNRGYGGALRSGFAEATREWVFYTDGDAQYDASELVALHRRRRPGVDIVQGYKLGRATRGTAR